MNSEIYLRPLTREAPLLNFELSIIESEIIRLDEIIDLCTDFDTDVLEYCESQLNTLVEYLENSIKIMLAA